MTLKKISLVLEVGHGKWHFHNIASATKVLYFHMFALIYLDLSWNEIVEINQGKFIYLYIHRIYIYLYIIHTPFSSQSYNYQLNTISTHSSIIENLGYKYSSHSPFLFIRSE